MRAFQGFWGAVSTRAVFDPELSDRALRVLAALSTWADRNRICDPRQGELAKSFGVSQQAISKQLTELVKRGYLKIERGGFPAHNVYRIILDQPDMPDTGTLPEAPEASKPAAPANIAVTTRRLYQAKVVTAQAPVTTSEVVTSYNPQVVTDTTSEVVAVPIETEFKTEFKTEVSCARVQVASLHDHPPKLLSLARKWANSQSGRRWREGMDQPFDWQRSSQILNAFHEYLDWTDKTVEEIEGELVIT